MTTSDGTAPTELVGTVEVRVVNAGSKAEMTAAVLVPDDLLADPVQLRRRDATALDLEPELAAYDGRRVRVIGELTWATFVVDAIEAAE
jgi:hypothetical protein